MSNQGKKLWAILRRLRTLAGNRPATGKSSQEKVGRPVYAPGKNAARIAFTARRRRRFYHALHLSGLWR
jgi:hypothetical protein